MDYRELLLKYLRHIERQAGQTHTADRFFDHTLFTGSEWMILQSLDAEAYKKEHDIS